MASITATIASPSFSSQGEGPPSPPYQSVEDLTNWFSSELHFFLITNNARESIVVPTQAGSFKGPGRAHANYHQGHPEGITTLATAIIPFDGRAVPTMVTLSLVPLHLQAGQYALSLDQGSEFSPFSPSHPPGPSYLSADYPMTGIDITTDPRCLEYAPSPSGFQILPRNAIPRPEVGYDHQPPGQGDPIEAVSNCTPAEVTASSGVAVYPLPFNQTHGFFGHPLSSPLVDRDIFPPAHATYQTEWNGQSTSRKRGQTHQNTPTFSDTAGPIRDVVVNQLPRRHQCPVCDASYVRFSGLNRHYKDKHTARMACRRCNFKFSLGRMYKFTEHLQTCPGA